MKQFWQSLTIYFSNKSIQKQLLFTHVSVILIPIIAIAVISYGSSSKIISKEVTENNQQLIEGIERNIKLYLKDLEDEAMTFSTRMINSNVDLHTDRLLSNVDSISSIKEINNYLYSTFDSSKDYLNIRVFSDEGEFISSAYNKDNYNLFSYNSPEEKIWQERMLKNEQNVLLYNIHPLEIGGEYSFVASKPVINQFSNERISYISFDKALTSFTDIFQQFENRESSAVQVIKEDGTILYHTNHSFIGTLANRTLVDRARESVAKSFSLSVDGVDQLIVSRQLAGENLLVIGSVEQKFLSNRLASLRNLTLLISIISLILVLILSALLSVGLSKPIKQLSKLMSEVEKGDLEININIPKANIETDVLSRSFQSMVAKIKSLIKTQYESEIYRKNAELKALLMQINPHFLYNTLEVIEGIADEKKAYQISDISQALSKMLRYSIDLKQEKVRISQEIKNCLDFFLILKSRFEDQLIIDYKIDPAVENYMIIKMVLQPLVENSIKHGVEKKFGTGLISLNVFQEGEYVVLVLTDNGAGFDENKFEEFQQFMKSASLKTYSPSDNKNLGLKNVYSRLKMVFGEDLYFHIDSVPGQGTKFTIKFPAIDYTESLRREQNERTFGNFGGD